MFFKPKIGDKVILWKDESLWVGTITNYTDSEFTWYSGWHDEFWEMKIEDCEKGKSFDYWIGKTLVFTRERIIGVETFCLYTEEKYKKVKIAVKALRNAHYRIEKLFSGKD